MRQAIEPRKISLPDCLASATGLLIVGYPKLRRLDALIPAFYAAIITFHAAII